MIQIAISKTSSGLEVIYSNLEDSTKIDDFDPVLRDVKLPEALFLSFGTDGVNIYYCKFIQGRPGDNAAFVIHIPKNVTIDDNSLKQLIDQLKEISLLSETDIKSKKSELDRMCQEYGKHSEPVKWYGQYELPNTNEPKKYGYVSYNPTYHENEAIAPYLEYQSSFAGYTYIFFVRNDTQIQQATQIKGAAQKWVKIRAPKRTEPWRKYYRPNFQEKALVGTNIDVKWEGDEGFVSKTESIKIEVEDDNDTFELPPLQENEIKRKVSKDLLIVKNKRNQTVSNFIVRFNKRSDEEVISYANLDKVHVVVSHSDYKSYEETLDLTADHKVVELEDKGVIYRVHGQNGNIYELKGCQSRNYMESPLEGYESFRSANSRDGNIEITLTYIRPKKKLISWSSFILGAVAMFLVGSTAIYGLSKFNMIGFGGHKTENVQKSSKSSKNSKNIQDADKQTSAPTDSSQSKEVTEDAKAEANTTTAKDSSNNPKD